VLCIVIGAHVLTGAPAPGIEGNDYPVCAVLLERLSRPFGIDFSPNTTVHPRQIAGGDGMDALFLQNLGNVDLNRLAHQRVRQSHNDGDLLRLVRHRLIRPPTINHLGLRASHQAHHYQKPGHRAQKLN
jgi:hypothetical protein